MGGAIGRPTVIGPELREGALVPVSELYSEVRISSRLVATSTARRKPEMKAAGHGSCRWPTTSVGAKTTPRNRQVPRVAARETWRVEYL